MADAKSEGLRYKPAGDPSLDETSVRIAMGSSTLMPSTPPTGLSKRRSRSRLCLSHDEHWRIKRPELVAKTAVSLQRVFAGSVRPGDRLHYKVPRFQLGDAVDVVIYEGRDGCALNGDFDRFAADTRVFARLAEDDMMGSGRYLGQPIRSALDDHGYAEWVRSVRAPSGQLAGVQALLLARDRRFNARVAWRRAMWHVRLFLTLWWASEQHAVAHGRYSIPDIAKFHADMTGSGLVMCEPYS